MSSLPGITRQDEEKRLQHTLEIAQRKVDANRQSVQALAEELHAMQEEFDENDKEAQTLWHNADARFKFVNQDLRRAEQARKKPYFGRIDFRDKKLRLPRWSPPKKAEEKTLPMLLPPLPLLRRSGRSVRRRPPHPVQPHAALRERHRNCRHTRRTRCSSRSGCVRRRRC